MMSKMYRILGKRGRITIPYEIRQRVGFAYNDVLSFEESEDGKAVLDYIIHGICGWDVAVFFQDARKQDYWMGQRSVAKRLMILTQDNKPTIDEKE